MISGYQTFIIFAFFLPALLQVQILSYENNHPKITKIPDHIPYKRKDLARYNPEYHLSSNFKLPNYNEIKVIKSKKLTKISNESISSLYNFMISQVNFFRHANLDNNVLCSGFFYENSILTAAHCFPYDDLEDFFYYSAPYEKIRFTSASQNYIADVWEVSFWDIFLNSLDQYVLDLLNYELELCNSLNWFWNDLLILNPDTLPITTNLNYTENIKIGDVVVILGIVPEINDIRTKEKLKSSGLNLTDLSEVYAAFGNPGSFYIGLGTIMNFDNISICYDIPTLMGTSGGPVFLFKEGHSTFDFVGVHITGGRDFKTSSGLRKSLIDQKFERKKSSQIWVFTIILIIEFAIFLILGVAIFKYVSKVLNKSLGIFLLLVSYHVFRLTLVFQYAFMRITGRRIRISF